MSLVVNTNVALFKCPTLSRFIWCIQLKTAMERLSTLGKKINSAADDRSASLPPLLSA